MKRASLFTAVLLACALPAMASGSEETLKISNFWFWLPLNLGLFVLVLGYFIGKPMARFLESRRQGIADELTQARDKLAEAEELRAQVLKRLDEVEQEVAQLRARAEREGQAEAARIDESAVAEEERFLKRVDEEIARRQAETRDTLAREAAALTAQLTRELLTAEITSDDRHNVLDRSLAAMRELQHKD